MASPLRRLAWERYLRNRSGSQERAAKVKSLAAERAYARVLMERVEARRKAMSRKDSDS